MWANCSVCPPKLSNVSKSLRSLTKNEQMSELLIFLNESLIRSLFAIFSQKTSNSLRKPMNEFPNPEKKRIEGEHWEIYYGFKPRTAASTKHLATPSPGIIFLTTFYFIVEKCRFRRGVQLLSITIQDYFCLIISKYVLYIHIGKNKFIDIEQLQDFTVVYNLFFTPWISTHFGRRRVSGLGQESGRNLIIFWCRLIEEYIYMYIYRVYVYDMYTVYIHLWYVYGLLGRYLPKAVYWLIEYTQ